MAYFIFTKNLDDQLGTLYRIAENESDFNNLNLPQLTYEIIQDSNDNFLSVKLGTKNIVKYHNNSIVYADYITEFTKQDRLISYIEAYKNLITSFLNGNSNHPLFNRWDNYKNQLSNVNTSAIVDWETSILDKSLEKYFKDLGQNALNPLQLP